MAEDAFLGITHTTSGDRWIEASTQLSGPNQDRLAAALMDDFDDLPIPLARIMAGMGIIHSPNLAVPRFSTHAQTIAANSMRFTYAEALFLG